MKDITPTYLTKDFVKRTLETGLKISNVEIENFIVSNASGKGENYTSELFRVYVTYKLSQQGSKQISLIVKNILKHLEEDTFNHLDVVKNEINMYTEVIPEIEHLLGNSSMLAPKCFIADEEEQLLVIADLKTLGYELQERIEGLNEAHCKLVMKRIAQLHAGSMCLVKTNPKYADIFNKPMFNELTKESDHISKVIQFNFEQMIDIVKTWSGYENIVVKLEKISKNMMERGIDHCRRKEGELQVINHGDLWVNNLMFKYNKSNNTPLDMAFIDLQLSYYGSLGIDINYFLSTSAQLDVLKSKRTELLEIYYETLKSTLEQLNYSPIPSWEEVSKEVRAKEYYGLVTICAVLPIISMDKSASENSTIETMLDDSPEKLNAMFGSERMIETLKYSLKRFDELGVLDE